MYVRPFIEKAANLVLWKMTAAASSLADSGRLWYQTSDSALRKNFNLSKSGLEKAPYFRHDADDDLLFVLIA